MPIDATPCREIIRVRSTTSRTALIGLAASTAAEQDGQSVPVVSVSHRSSIALRPTAMVRWPATARFGRFRYHRFPMRLQTNHPRETGEDDVTTFSLFEAEFNLRRCVLQRFSLMKTVERLEFLNTFWITSCYSVMILHFSFSGWSRLFRGRFYFFLTRKTWFF